MSINLRGAVLIFPPLKDFTTICQLSVGTNWNRFHPNNLGVGSLRREAAYIY